MQGLVELIRYFYEQWILRDVLGYVTPGAIVVIAVSLQYANPEKIVETLGEIPIIAYIPLYGLLFAVGFAIQNLGEILRLLKWHNRDSDDIQFQKLEKFHGVTQGDEHGWLERTRERISVKKNMSGTVSVAIIISLIFFLIDWITKDQLIVNIAVTILALFLILALLCGHRHHRKFQLYWENIVIQEKKREKEVDR
jgi:hypothetical protein